MSTTPMVMRPETTYASLGDSRVAYQSFGPERDAPVIVLGAGLITNVETRWDHPTVEALLRRLGSFARVVVFDPRGVGLSGPAPTTGAPPWERWAEELETVLDALCCERAAVCGYNEAGPGAMQFAAEHPDRTCALFLVNTGARGLIADDYPCGLSRWSAESMLSVVEELWGTEALATLLAPTMAHDKVFVRWLASYLRSAADSTRAAHIMREVLEGDLRGTLCGIKAPTVVMSRTANRFASPEMGRHLADNIDGARFVELPGEDTSFYSKSSEATFAIIEGALATLPKP